jgi:endonuclease-3
MQNVIKVISKLRRQYPRFKFAENNRRDPFRVLIACIISQRTRDEQTDKVSSALFHLAGSLTKMLTLPQAKLEKVLHPAGFYRQKARCIKRVCQELVERHGGNVPCDEKALLALPGVGRKTANIVLSFAFGIPAIAVDTHVHRICNRLGWVNTRTAHETEKELEKIVPRRYWVQINDIMVRHGQAICLPRQPRCDRCPVGQLCATGCGAQSGVRL